MKYKVTHTTSYVYADTVPVCQNIVYLTPRKTPKQGCAWNRLTIHPHPKVVHRRIDYFGNVAHAFSLEGGLRKWQISAISTVDVSDHAPPPLAADCVTNEPWEGIRDRLPHDLSADGLNNYQFVFPSPHVPLESDLGDYARVSFSDGRPIFDALAELNGRMHHDFQYDAQATTIQTPIGDVFRNRRGVCQDFAHLMIGCLRPLGLAARYVSGYLRTLPQDGQDQLVGASASHAWVSVWAGASGWLDLDPTNNLWVTNDHITLAWGRDYSDVCPVAGMFVGGGADEISVSVNVAPL